MKLAVLNQNRLADEEILHLYLQTRSDKWFTVLYERHVRKIRRLCISVTKDPLLAEDYTQDIFIRTFSKLEQFEGRASFSSWLYSLAYHYCLGVLRKHARLPMVALEDHHNLLAGEPEDDNFAQRWHRVARVMATLSADDQQLLQLKYEESLGIQEIASRYETSEGSIKMRLKRARGRIMMSCNKMAA
ncbi:RNA polymerase sigma factor [Tellurirhabdus rosea]|uniref:RNA polymerase sigma factor n=1 Tax=Tellurirhabdus rosea TaxID=2674997 RepID=UPI00225962C9|nr:RNA polymerase sigma factor [Tellurirhabdus rosea]